MNSRAIATVVLWITYLLMIMSSMLIGNLGAWSILMAFVLMMPLIPITGMMWNWGDAESSSNSNSKEASQEEIEKRKRDRLDAVLRELSDEDLHHLRKRLSVGDIDDEALYDMMIGDDGELIQRR